MTTENDLPHATFPLETVYEALGERRRRYVLYHLREEANGVTDLGACIEAVCSLEADHGDVADAKTDDHHERVSTNLHHVHLPMLVDRGVLDYDWRTNTIRYRGEPILERHLDLAESYELE